MAVCDWFSLVFSFHNLKVHSLVTQSYLTLCHPMDCRLPGSSVHGIFQARVLSGLPFPSPGDLLNPGIELRSPALQSDSLPSEPTGKPPSSALWLANQWWYQFWCWWRFRQSKLQLMYQPIHLSFLCLLFREVAIAHSICRLSTGSGETPTSGHCWLDKNRHLI